MYLQSSIFPAYIKIPNFSNNLLVIREDGSVAVKTISTGNYFYLSKERTCVTIYEDNSNKRFNVNINRIFASIFFPSTDSSKNILIALDGDLTNLNEENLKWVDKKEFTTFNSSRSKPKKVVKNSLSKEDIYLIHKYSNEGLSNISISRQLGQPLDLVNSCIGLNKKMQSTLDLSMF